MTIGARAISALTGDPRDPELNGWLRTLAPRAELAVRFAMRAKFHELRGERGFAARVQHLVSTLHLSGDELTDVIAASRRLGECGEAFLREVEVQLGETQPPPRSRQSDRMRR